MRLTAEEVNKIKEIIHKKLSVADIFLFGSRTDDHKKGGDVDLYILTQSRVVFLTQMEIEIEISDFMEIKVDLVFDSVESPNRSLIVNVCREGIKL